MTCVTAEETKALSQHGWIPCVLTSKSSIHSFNQELQLYEMLDLDAEGEDETMIQGYINGLVTASIYYVDYILQQCCCVRHAALASGDSARPWTDGCVPVKSTKSESSHDLDESHNIHNVQAGSDLDLDSTTTTFSHQAAADIFFLPSLISAQMNRRLCYAKSVTFGAASQSCGPRSLSTLAS
jgi:hypothetical protein